MVSPFKNTSFIQEHISTIKLIINYVAATQCFFLPNTTVAKSCNRANQQSKNGSVVKQENDIKRRMGEKAKAG
jgi:hypothetical protein